MQKKEQVKKGATEEEINDTLGNRKFAIAKGNRLAKEKVYGCNKDWMGKTYEEKQVKVIYIIEHNIIVVITVVVKYGNFIKT
ncbi:MAG TPA: hypothetical protein VNA26_04495 [Chitinophagaceae bacterium]|nr:hypothetical protein [Chitinophagaceae bacterium]